VNRDSEGLAKDFVMLDFIPPGTDLGPIAHELQASFGDEETKSQLDFQVSISPLKLQPYIVHTLCMYRISCFLFKGFTIAVLIGYWLVTQGIMNQLWTVMYKFNFQLSPEYAMVVRALGSLEGTATTLDPGFKVVSNAYPFILGRLLADPDPQMRETLRELLIRNNGSIRWHRLERLVIFRLCH
jgi:aarF domain-containing kinase